MRRWLLVLIAALGAVPLIAIGDPSPTLTNAEAGPDGAIKRLTMHFSAAVVPLGDPRAPAPATMNCPMPADGHWVDTQTYVFEFARVLPGGLRCSAVLRPDLKTPGGISVTGARVTMIDTGGPTARAVLGGTQYLIEEDQVFLVAPNVAPKPGSVAANAYCAVEGIGEKIPVEVLPQDAVTKLIQDLGTHNYRVNNFLQTAGVGTGDAESEDGSNAAAAAPDPGARGTGPDPKALARIIGVKCQRALPPGHRMALVWASGISTADGHLAGRDQRFDFEVRKAFTATFSCSRTNARAGCNPIESAFVRFTDDVPLAMAQGITLTFADGTTRAPAFDKDAQRSQRVSEIEFKGPLPPATTATVTLPSGFVDASGRPLENAAHFPLQVRIDEAPPLVKFAANFGIVEANEGGVLPVTVRAVEPQLAQTVHGVAGTSLRIDASDGEIAQWLKKLEAHEETPDNSDTADDDEGAAAKPKRIRHYPGEAPLLNGQGSKMKLDLPGGGKAFEVVGIPLKAPGFYVVELASPRLGQALMHRDAPRYVAAGALVTNMAVHFKWGREASLAWVTTLDKAQTVGSAEIRITDTCTGKELARGVTDSAGRLLIRHLPTPTSDGGCEGVDPDHPLMVSARKDGDFSFTMTEWGKGIQPSDFELPYSYGREDHDILHTVFDRSLIRAGETVNMKHLLRRPTIDGFSLAKGFSGTLELTHFGSDTKFELPVTIGADGVGETHWTAPQGAPQGDYGLSFKVGDKIISTDQTLRVDEFRIPTMRAQIAGPKAALVRPSAVPLDLFVGYFAGGAASNMPVSIRTMYALSERTPDGWDGWSFGGRAPVEGTVPLNGEGDDDGPPPTPLAATTPLTLGRDGTAKFNATPDKPIDANMTMAVEMDYQDANGETLTARQSIALFASGVQIGIKTDGWIMRDTDLRLKIAALDLNNKVVAGQQVRVDVYTREILTARRRLIGGFYAYDSQAKTTRVGAGCSATTDAQGLASCALDPGVSGEVIVVASTTDANGNISRAVKTVWLAGENEWWFGGDNGDRMDVVPEQKSYKAGDTARFQVRMPFRNATALVTVEREGVISSFTTELSGKDPVVEMKLPGSDAPNVYVSVMAVRGRIGGWSLWWADLARRWHLPFFSREGQEPTALVDLAKPSYRIGIAQVAVGWEAHQLNVKVTPDHSRYGIRQTAHVDVAVTGPRGKLPAGSEVAFVAIDEALLSLKANDSTDVLKAMMGQRALGVLTSTAQTQVVGKRHYGKKAVAAGGGGGDASGVARDDFRPELLWKGRVTLDANGHAKLDVPLADSLSSYKLIAIATGGADLFGTGEANIRTAQDLSIYSGIPPLVRSGDQYGATFTLHNGTDHAMTVEARMALSPAIATAAPLSVTIPAGGAAPVTWNLTAPEAAGALNWHVSAHEVGGPASDQINVTQAVVPLVAVDVWAAQLMQGGGTGISLAAPDGALAGRGFVDVKLSDTLAPPLGSVRDYMTAYPYNCFEQRLSRIVVQHDSAGWEKLAKDIPAYLDGDGLLRYFPVAQMRGSDALTAYVLSITAEAGLAIPDAQKAKMIAAMQNIVAGKLKNGVAWDADARLIKVMALGALARNDAATPQMLAGAYVAPQDSPTSILVDWLVAVDRTHANPALRAQGEQVLRQRLVYAGSRVDLTDGANEPWYVMSTPDEASLKLLGYALGRPGWQSDVPKLMVGVAMRQAHGHWDTTLANAWGVVATEHFAKLYPASAVKGVTTIALGTARATQAWPQAADAKPIRLALPFTKTPLLINQAGGTPPWALVSVHAAVPLRAPLFTGYKIAREISPVLQKVPGQWSRGDVMKIRLTIDASAGRTWVVINDPVPPGATIINDLGGQSAMLGAAAQGSGTSFPDYVDRTNDGWHGFYQWVPTGRLVAEYAVRLNGTGTFHLPPTRVEAMYSPDIRGQLPNDPVTVTMR